MLRAGNGRRRLREEEGGELAAWVLFVSEGERQGEGSTSHCLRGLETECETFSFGRERVGWHWAFGLGQLG